MIGRYGLMSRRNFRCALSKPSAVLHVIWEHFVFNEPVDESLFSLTPPAGYKVTEKAVPATSAPTENDLINGLHAVTAMMGGQFPSEFNMAAILKELTDLRNKGVKPDYSGLKREEVVTSLYAGRSSLSRY